MTEFVKYFRRLTPFLAAVVLFFVLAVLYFAPQFAGEELPQHDVVQYEGMAHDIRECRAETGEDPQWTGGMFGGMPAYLINVAYPAQLVKNSIGRIVGVMDTPAAFILFAMLAMWIMLSVMRINPWVALASAVAYGFSTYFLLIIGAGHITKMWALVYAPLMMGGAWLTLRGNMWYGAAFTAMFTSLEVGANHPQITYYFIVAMAFMWLSELWFAYKDKLLKEFGQRTLLLALAGIVAVGSNFSPLWYTMQHTPDTIRAGSELAATDSGADRGGLDLEYATAWSYGRAESWNMLIPDFMGGDSMRSFSNDGEVAEALSPYGLEQLAVQLPLYWGEQPFTAGPTYIGAVVIMLAMMALMIIPGREKWWAVAACVVALLLAWGSNFMWFTELMFKILPGYNKFRTVSMFLVVIEWVVPMLAAYALMALWSSKEEDRASMVKPLNWSLALCGGVCLLFAVVGPHIFDFGYEADRHNLTMQFSEWFRGAGMTAELQQGLDVEIGDVTARAMAAERASVMASDAWRSFDLILAVWAVIWLFLKRKFITLPKWAVVAAVTALVVVDLVPVNLRYLNHDNFVAPSRNRVVATNADKQILQDGELGYRVLNLTVSPFNDATTSYFHRSVGGYHGAKLSRYQDVIDRYLVEFDEGVLDMLNTRYVIISPDSVIRRPSANGAAWFVDYTLPVESAEEEISRLGEIDTRRVAVIREEDITKADHLPMEVPDSIFPFEGRIELVEYQPNRLKYEYSSTHNAVALFSEIYYDKGWSAYIDGQSAPYFRANYILRGMQLPKGEHVVEWRFRAPSWGVVEGVTLLCSIVILLGAVAAIYFGVRRLLKESSDER